MGHKVRLFFKTTVVFMLLLLVACLLPAGAIAASQVSSSSSNVQALGFLAPLRGATPITLPETNTDQIHLLALPIMGDNAGIFYGFLAGICICGLIILLTPARTKRVYIITRIATKPLYSQTLSLYTQPIPLFTQPIPLGKY